MSVLIEQQNDQVTDCSDLAAGWQQHGNIAISHDTSRGVFERLNGSSAAYSYPLPAANGAGFVETCVPVDFLLAVDFATDGAHGSDNTQWVGVSLRRRDGQVQWLFPNHAAGTLVSVRDVGAGAGPSFETALTLPASASRRYELELGWDAAAVKVALRVRAFEDREDLDAWVQGTLATTSLNAPPEKAGISMCAPVGRDGSRALRLPAAPGCAESSGAVLVRARRRRGQPSLCRGSANAEEPRHLGRALVA
jgi:hypothetical protein